MLYQNNLQPLAVNTVATTPQIATLKIDDVELGKLTAFPQAGKLLYYYESLLRNIKIQEDYPDFVTKYRIIKPNVRVLLMANNQTISADTLTCGFGIPTSKRLTNNQKRTAFDAPFQVVYFITEPVFARLYASVNNGDFTELDLMQVLDVPKGAYLIINLHQYFEELNLSEDDTVCFRFDKLPFREVIQFEAYYTDFPFHFVQRNQYGFWDCYRFYGNRENTIDFKTETLENIQGTQTIYNESTEKVTVETGLLEQSEKKNIAENLRNLDLFELRNQQLVRLNLALKSIQSVSQKESQDTLKLEFTYATITRRYR